MRLAPQTRARLLQNIEGEADRLVHFVTGALALGRLENGPIPESAWNAPGEIVSAVLDRCLPALGTRPVTFAVANDLPLVKMDAGLLDQALSVLLENVAVHTPPGTPVAIEGSVKDSDFYLAVSDAGAGVPMDARERIFVKYQRLDEQRPGFGLGLAIARAAVDIQGGRLWVEDSVLGGARFVLMMPNAVATRREA
jgi:two-component system sensor histidine kinase KdpD